MNPRTLQPIVDEIVGFARSHGGPTSNETTESLVREVLVGERSLLAALEHGLVLQDEVVDALLDRFRIAAFGASDAGPSSAEWSSLRSSVARALSSRLEG